MMKNLPDKRSVIKSALINATIFAIALVCESHVLGNSGKLFSFFTGGAGSEFHEFTPLKTKILVGPDVIFFGSSYTFYGIHVEVIEEETGMSAINISAVGARFGYIRYLFYRALSRRRGVKIAVVEIITDEQYMMMRKALSVSVKEIDELLAMKAWAKGMGIETIFYFPPSGRSPDSIERVKVLDFDDPLAYPELFDPSVRHDDKAHLNAKGARIFSDLISVEISAAISQTWN